MNRDLIDRFYRSFAEHDGDSMASCYSADVVFEDPVFGELNGPDAGDMWRMLCGSAPDLRVDYTIELSDDRSARVRWTAHYTFPATGRVVHNEVVATITIGDGSIVDHRDRFSLWKWSTQALGPPGRLLGWSPPLQRKIRGMARQGLSDYQGRRSDSPASTESPAPTNNPAPTKNPASTESPAPTKNPASTESPASTEIATSPEIPVTLDGCRQCGFDPEVWNDQDSATTLRSTAVFFQYWAAPLDAATLNVRPSPEVWSAAEHVDHLRATLRDTRLLIESARDHPGHDLGPGASLGPNPAGDRRPLDFRTCLETVAVEADTLWTVLHQLDEHEWSHTARLAGIDHTISEASRLAVHDLWHHLGDMGRIAATTGASSPPQQGRVHQLNISGGGVPKTAIGSVKVDRRGVVGDIQKTRRVHGRPWQALCLWSNEVIDELVAEGHTVHPGAAGENVTIAGLDWAALHAGLVITIGEVTCQLSAPAAPCAKIRGWFADHDSGRIDHDTHPGFARWYATVLSSGQISAGDRIETSSQPVEQPPPG